jgi:hypothetical protein
MKKKKGKKKKGIIERMKRLPFSIVLIGLISGLIGCVIVYSCLTALTSADRDQFLNAGMFYAFFGFGIMLLVFSYFLLSGKYKLSLKEKSERAKRQPDLMCKNCGQRPTLYIDDEGGSKTLYGNRCPYCGHRLF